MDFETDICGLCGEPGADKIACPNHWPGEQTSHTGFVHAECENDEQIRAFNELTQHQRDAFLREVSKYG